MRASAEFMHSNLLARSVNGLFSIPIAKHTQFGSLEVGLLPPRISSASLPPSEHVVCWYFRSCILGRPVVRNIQSAYETCHPRWLYFESDETAVRFNISEYLWLITAVGIFAFVVAPQLLCFVLRRASWKVACHLLKYYHTTGTSNVFIMLYTLAFQRRLIYLVDGDCVSDVTSQPTRANHFAAEPSDVCRRCGLLGKSWPVFSNKIGDKVSDRLQGRCGLHCLAVYLVESLG